MQASGRYRDMVDLQTSVAPVHAVIAESAAVSAELLHG
jgi:hypothetical protein